MWVRDSWCIGDCLVLLVWLSFVWNWYALIICDNMTWWPEGAPLHSTEAERALQGLVEHFCVGWDTLMEKRSTSYPLLHLAGLLGLQTRARHITILDLASVYCLQEGYKCKSALPPFNCYTAFRTLGPQVAFQHLLGFFLQLQVEDMAAWLEDTISYGSSVQSQWNQLKN